MWLCFLYLHRSPEFFYIYLLDLLIYFSHPFIGAGAAISRGPHRRIFRTGVTQTFLSILLCLILHQLERKHKSTDTAKGELLLISGRYFDLEEAISLILMSPLVQPSSKYPLSLLVPVSLLALAPPETTILTALPGSLIPPALPWSDVALLFIYIFLWNL